jgi:opacity protein-like surface antigen
MKNKLFGVGLIFVAGLLTQTASAQVYVGVDLGKTNKGENSSTCFVCRDGMTVGKLNLGYDINQDFAVEAGLFKSVKTYSGDRTLYDWNSNNLYTVSYDTKISGFQLAGIVKKEFSNAFGGYVKLGLSRVKFDRDYKEKKVTSTSSTNFSRLQFNESYTCPMLALGLSYKINSNLSARTEFETVRMNGRTEKNIDTLSLGLQYKF